MHHWSLYTNHVSHDPHQRRVLAIYVADVNLQKKNLYNGPIYIKHVSPISAIEFFTAQAQQSLMKEHTDCKSQDQDIAKTNKIVCSWSNFRLAEEVVASFLLLVVGSILADPHSHQVAENFLWLVWSWKRRKPILVMSPYPKLYVACLTYHFEDKNIMLIQV
jgi:hypothetical protein